MLVRNPVTGNYGVDVAGTQKIPAPSAPPNHFLTTQSRPLPVVFEGWLLDGLFTENVIGLRPGDSLQSFYPEAVFIPESAGPSPGPGYRYVVVRIMHGTNWDDDLMFFNGGVY